MNRTKITWTEIMNERWINEVEKYLKRAELTQKQEERLLKILIRRLNGK